MRQELTATPSQKYDQDSSLAEIPPLVGAAGGMGRAQLSAWYIVDICNSPEQHSLPLLYLRLFLQKDKKHSLLLPSTPFLPQLLCLQPHWQLQLASPSSLKLVFTRKLGFDLSGSFSESFLLLGKFQHFFQEREEKIGQDKMFVWETNYFFFFEREQLLDYYFYFILFCEREKLTYALFSFCLSNFSTTEIFVHHFFWL